MEYFDRIGKMEYVLRTIIPKNLADPVSVFDTVFNLPDERLLEFVTISDRMNECDLYEKEESLRHFANGSPLAFVERDIRNVLYKYPIR